MIIVPIPACPCVFVHVDFSVEKPEGASLSCRVMIDCLSNYRHVASAPVSAREPLMWWHIFPHLYLFQFTGGEMFSFLLP